MLRAVEVTLLLLMLVPRVTATAGRWQKRAAFQPCPLLVSHLCHEAIPPGSENLPVLPLPWSCRSYCGCLGGKVTNQHGDGSLLQARNVVISHQGSSYTCVTDAMDHGRRTARRWPSSIAKHHSLLAVLMCLISCPAALPSTMALLCGLLAQWSLPPSLAGLCPSAVISALQEPHVQPSPTQTQLLNKSAKPVCLGFVFFFFFPFQLRFTFHLNFIAGNFSERHRDPGDLACLYLREKLSFVPQQQPAGSMAGASFLAAGAWGEPLSPGLRAARL